MHFEKLDLRAYGRFTNHSIDLSAGPNRFHIIYGANESGKSTTLRAVTSLLYGFPAKTDDDYFHPMKQLRVGGTLTDAASGRSLVVVRRKGTRATLLSDDESEQIPEQAMVEMMGGVTREDFTTRFALSHDELVAGGQSIVKGQGDLGEILFSAGAGIGKLREVQDQIEKEYGELFKPRGKNSSINRALAELSEKRKQLREHQIPTARYKSLRRELADACDEAKRVETEVVQSASRLERLGAMAKAMPLIPQWQSIVARDDATAEVVLLDEDFTQARRQASDQLSIAILRLTEQRRRVETLVTKRDEHEPDEIIVSVGREIESLFADKSAIDKIVVERDNLLAERDRGLRQLQKMLAELSIDVGDRDIDAEEAMIGLSDAVDSINVSESNRGKIISMAGQRGEWLAQQSRAERDIESNDQQLRSIQRDIDQMGPPPGSGELAEVLAAIGNVHELLAHHEQCVETVEQSTAHCETLRTHLIGNHQTIDEAVGLSVPDAADVERIEQSIHKTASHCSQLQSSLTNLEKRKRQIEQERGLIDTRGELPTEDDLRSSRATRDEHIRSTDNESFDDRRGMILETIQHADEIVDTLRQQRDKILRIEQFDLQIDQIEDELAATTAAFDLAQSDAEAANTRWESLWKQAGVKAASPDAMKKWVACHQRLVEANAQRETAMSRHQRSENKLRRRFEQLAQCLGESATNDVADLGGAVHRGQTHLRRMADIERQWESLNKDRQRLAKAQENANNELVDAKQRLENWQRDWNALTSSIGGQNGDPNEVLARLGRITELVAARKDVQQLFARIRSMTDEESTFVLRVSRIAEAVDHAGAVTDSSSAIIAIGQMHRRLNDELAREQTRGECDEQLKELAVQIEQSELDRQKYEAVLGGLAEEAKTDRVETLPDLERAAAQRREILSQRRQIEQQLLILAADQELSKFAASLDQFSAAELELQIEQCEEGLITARERLAEVNQQVGALRNEFSKMDGSAGGAAIAQDIQMMTGKIEQDVRQYALQQTQSILLRRAIEHYRNENQSPVLALARETFSTLTLGRYQTLRTDFDAKGRTILTAVPDDGGPEVPANLLSTGTADALYLSLRLASLRHQIDHSTPLPLIVDDCLVQMDEDRSAAAMSLMSEMSTQTQVIMFTHHQNLVELANKTLPSGGVHCHQLA